MIETQPLLGCHRKCLYPAGALLLCLLQLVIDGILGRSNLEVLEGSTKSYQSASGSHRARFVPTFLWGIPSVDNDNERIRRETIRETYLSFYKDSKEFPDRVCSLNDILRNKVPFEDCQVAYAFFIGANPDGPTELLFPNKSYPMLANPPQSSKIRSEDDIVYLNIRENQEDGKMPTWFKFASMITEEKKYPFDYIAKIDSDTLIFMPAFLEFSETHMIDTTRLVHAGYPMFDYFCNPQARNHSHPCPIPLTGELYMSGEASIMSSELARIMTSRECNRSGLFIRHEDVLLSNWAFHCVASTRNNSTVHIVPIRREQILRDQSKGLRSKILPHRFSYTLLAHASGSKSYYKDTRNFRQTWTDFLEYWTNKNSTRTVVSLKITRC